MNEAWLFLKGVPHPAAIALGMEKERDLLLGSNFDWGGWLPTGKDTSYTETEDGAECSTSCI